jgi:hypothetical protein
MDESDHCVLQKTPGSTTIRTYPIVTMTGSFALVETFRTVGTSVALVTLVRRDSSLG